MCMENREIRVCLHPTTGGLQAITDMSRNISYEFVSSGFSLTADGTQYFVDPKAVSFEKTDTGVRVLFKDGPFVAECIYTVPEKGAFVERQLRFMCESGMWTAEKIVCEHAVFSKEAESIHFHDDQTLWHVPTNYFIRYSDGGMYMGLAYPYWDREDNAKDSITLGFTPRYTVQEGQWFEAEKTFWGVYRREGITRYSHGPYPGEKNPAYHDIFAGTGLYQHFAGMKVPEDVGMPQEVLDWGEVWAVQEYFKHHLPRHPLPEEGFWLWQNGWWARLFSPDIHSIDPLLSTGVKDIMTAAMYYGHDRHPTTEPKYICDMSVDPIGFPVRSDADTSGVQEGTSGWHTVVEAGEERNDIVGYTDTFEAPADYVSFIHEAQKQGMYVSSFSTPNNSYKKRPQWYSRLKDGSPQKYFGTAVSCPACDEYMDFHFEMLCRVLDRYHQRLWSLDGRWLNYRELAGYHFETIGDEPCYSAEHGHPVAWDQYKAWKNTQLFKKKLRDRYPTLCLEQYYGLKRGGIWSLTSLNSDENYYEMGSVVNNRYQTWHNENSRFRPMYMNYSSIFGTDPASFEHSIISCLSTAAYGQVSRGYTALKDYPECADVLKRWKTWADENYRFLTDRRSLFGMPGEYAVDGSAHFVDDEGYIFLFTAPGNYADARILLNRWSGLTEDNSARYRVRLVAAVTDDGTAAECLMCNPVVAYGEKIRCRITPNTAVILHVERADDAEFPPNDADIMFADTDFVAESFPL